MGGVERLKALHERARRVWLYNLPDGIQLKLRPVKAGAAMLRTGVDEAALRSYWALQNSTPEERRERMLDDPEGALRAGLLREKLEEAYLVLGIEGAVIDGEDAPFEVLFDDEVGPDRKEHQFTVGELRALYGDDEIYMLVERIASLSGRIDPSEVGVDAARFREDGADDPRPVQDVPGA